MASSDSAAATLHGQIARTGHDKPQRIESSGISVLVVGAGVGGEMAALECWRQGHDVRVIERAANRLLSGMVELGPLQDSPCRRLTGIIGRRWVHHWS